MAWIRKNFFFGLLIFIACCDDFIWNNREKTKNENFTFHLCMFSFDFVSCPIGFAFYFAPDFVDF